MSKLRYRGSLSIEPPSDKTTVLTTFTECLERNEIDEAISMLENPSTFSAIKSELKSTVDYTDDPRWQPVSSHVYSLFDRSWECEKTLVDILLLNGRFDIIRKYQETGMISEKSIKQILEAVGIESLPETAVEFVNMVEIMEIHDE